MPKAYDEDEKGKSLTLQYPLGGEEGDSMDQLSFPEEHQQKIESWLQEVKFRKRVFGGVDESHVWTKIRELNDMYQMALAAERARYDALLAEREKGVSGT